MNDYLKFGNILGTDKQIAFANSIIDKEGLPLGTTPQFLISIKVKLG